MTVTLSLRLLRRMLSLSVLTSFLSISHADPARTTIVSVGTPEPLTAVAKLDGAGGRAVSFSQDGKMILTAGECDAQVWDATTYLPITNTLVHGEGLYDARFDAHGKRVLTVSATQKLLTVIHLGEETIERAGEVRVWDVATGKMLSPAIHHHGQKYCHAAISPDGTLVATCSEGDRIVCIWEANTGNQKLELNHEWPVWSVLFDLTGKTLITTGDKTVLWNTDSWRARASLPGRPDAPLGPTPDMTADGKRIVVGTEDRFEVYDFITGQKISDDKSRQSPVRNSIAGVAISPDGKRVATTGSTGGIVWDSTRGGPILSDVHGYDYSPVFSPDSKWVVFDSPIDPAIWNLATRKGIAVGSGFTPRVACFSPDGKKLAIGSLDGFTAILNVEDMSHLAAPSP